MKAASVEGWRVFLGEVGVIVLGVLIALGAQQAVAEIQIRGDVRTFRETIDHEIGLNLFAYDFRAGQQACLNRHIQDLRAWLADARAGKAVPAIVARGPMSLNKHRSAWDNKDANVFAHLPYAVRQKYAEFYDEVSNNEDLQRFEHDAWGRLATYQEPGPITLADRRIIRPALGSIQGLNDITAANLEVSMKIAKGLGIGPQRPDTLPSDFAVPKCESVIAKS